MQRGRNVRAKRGRGECGVSNRRPPIRQPERMRRESRYYSYTSKFFSFRSSELYLSRFLFHISFFLSPLYARVASPLSGFFTTWEIFSPCVAEHLAAFRERTQKRNLDGYRYIDITFPSSFRELVKEEKPRLCKLFDALLPDRKSVV